MPNETIATGLDLSRGKRTAKNKNEYINGITSVSSIYLMNSFSISKCRD